MSQSPYIDEMGVTERLDPHAPPQDTDFDWPLLRHRLGEESPDTGDMSEADGQALAKALKGVLAWAVDGWASGNIRGGKKIRGGSKFTALETVARRIVVLVWSLNPELLGSDAALRQVAKQLGCSTALLSSQDVAKVRQRFGIRNVYAAHDWRSKLNRTESQSDDSDDHHHGCECEICLDREGGEHGET
jgi:hypothetical protein